MNISIVPELKSLEIINGKSFELSGIVEITNFPSEFLTSLLLKIISNYSELQVSSKSHKKIEYSINSNLQIEEYRIEITECNINISASTSIGCNRALATLEHLFRNNIMLDACIIRDYPLYQHRELLVDSVRHFIPLDEIKLIIELMHKYKFNYLHWHLTDDQGWRIESKQYPLLHELGSKRTKSMNDMYDPNQEFPPNGYYTKEEIRYIVRYASDYGIEIYPEFDIPGHVTALLHAYNEYSCTSKNLEIATKAGVYKDILCIGNENTLPLVKNIITEIAELFPCHYFHIGGDEVPLDRWDNCPKCQEFILQNKLVDSIGLWHYFVDEIVAHLKSLEKIPLLWNDILTHGDYECDATFLFWSNRSNSESEKKNIEKTSRIIDLNYERYYFDYPNGIPSLRETYEYDSQFHKDFLIGMGGTIWSELIANRPTLYNQLFPRFWALSENAWGIKKRNFEEFVNRAERDREVLKEYNIQLDEFVLERPPNAEKLHQKQIKMWNQEKINLGEK